MNKVDHELLLELGFILVEQDLEDLYWLYSISDNGIDLQLSWSLTQSFVQTILSQQGVIITQIYSEGLTSSKVTSEGIEAGFSFDGASTTLRIQIKPSIQVQWNTLRS